MVEWSIEAFRAAGPVRSIVVACPAGHVHELGGHDLGVVEGGKTRSASVASALQAVGTELVAIHDAARPLLTAELVEQLVATLAKHPDASGVIAATPVVDTIKQVAIGEAAAGVRVPPPLSGGGNVPPSPSGAENVLPSRSGAEDEALVVAGTIDRGQLWAAQTPQVFRTAALRQALLADPGRAAAATDEAMVIEAAGGRVLIHPSSPRNLKVTTPLDLRLAELLFAGRDD
jgi:2-C-methyl-D-erythritol 4-phosphate cytidylyltransferase